MASAMDTVKAGKTIVVVVFLPDSAGCLPIVRTAKRGTWEYPAGKIEKTDASPEHAAAREVLEETGLRVLPTDLAGIGITTLQATAPATQHRAPRATDLPAIPSALLLWSAAL